jgi:predicted nucleic acid-binding protein
VPKTTRKSTVVSDANVLINLIIAKRVDLLRALPLHDFVAPLEVIVEVTNPLQRAALEQALSDELLKKCEIKSVAELEVFSELRSIMGRGEAACLALAQTNKWMIASDEKRAFRREAVRRLGEKLILTTPMIFFLGIQAKAMTIREADAAKKTLEQNRFRMAFASFREVVENPSLLKGK